MPATNWKAVTLTTRHLRPNFGYDPVVRELEKSCKQFSETCRWQDHERFVFNLREVDVPISKATYRSFFLEVN